MAGTGEPSSGYGPGLRFLPFSRLPVELRLAIWELNLPCSRIVSIRCGVQPASIPPGEPWGWDSNLVRCTSSSPIPVNLHVRRESRIEAMKRYKLMFGTERDPGRIFFDPLKDTLYFGARDGIAASEAQFDAFTKLVPARDMALVRHIAINETLIWGIDDVTWNELLAETTAATVPLPISPFPAAGGLTIAQVLRRAGACFRRLEQLSFVCNDRNPVYSADSVLVERRICEAVHAVEEEDRRRRRRRRRQPDPKTAATVTPPWNIRAIAADPDPPTYDRRILGYGRPGPPSFGHFRKRKRPWVGSQCACNACGQQQEEEDSSGQDFNKPSPSALGWCPC